MRRTPRSLIANEGYEVAWTGASPFFNQPLPPTVLSDGTLVPTPTPNQNPTNEYPWVARGYSIVIPGNVNPNVPLLLEDNYRNILILQNNSAAVAPDVAPNLFIALDGPVQFITINPVAGPAISYAYNALTLVPGEGLLLDTRVLGNALYFAWGVATNTGGTVGTFGMCIYGRTLNSVPNPNQAATAATIAQGPRYAVGGMSTPGRRR